MSKDKLLTELQNLEKRTPGILQQVKYHHRINPLKKHLILVITVQNYHCHYFNIEKECHENKY